MKNFTLLCGAVFLMSVGHAQTEQDYSKLPEFLKESSFQTELLNIKQEKPSKHTLISAYIAKGLQIVHLENANIKSTTIASVPLKDKTQQMSIADFLMYADQHALNPYAFMWSPQTQRQIFRLEGTDYYIVIPSQSDLK